MRFSNTVFQLVEGEVDLAHYALTRHEARSAEVAAKQDIPVLREMAAQAFAPQLSCPRYAPEDTDVSMPSGLRMR